MIRPATDADRQIVRLLQGLLDAPAPAMLELAFDTGVGTVFVATDARAVNAGKGDSADEGDPADEGNSADDRDDGTPDEESGHEVDQDPDEESDPDEETGPDDYGDVRNDGREAGGAVVGYALVLPGSLDAEPSVVYLAELVVAPGVRREGYGAALVDAVVDRFADYDQLRLTARADDDGVLDFYRELGFWTLDELPDYYRDGDGVLLVRDL